MVRAGFGAAIALLATILAAPAAAQNVATGRVTRGAVILEEPRGDSLLITRVGRGATLEILDRQGKWYLVRVPEGSGAVRPRGWIHLDSLDHVSGDVGAAKAPRPGRMLIRGFGHAGGTLFDARDSFEAIVGTTLGSIYGGGGQVVFKNGGFAQVSVDQFKETGSRALVTGNQLFTLDTPARITMRPILITGGYRSETAHRFAPYVGAGVGWHSLTEESPSAIGVERITRHELGYHVVGGTEYPLTRWFGVAGEVQWTTVPKLLGETGVSAVFAEDDLGGTTFRVKFIIGH